MKDTRQNEIHHISLRLLDVLLVNMGKINSNHAATCLLALHSKNILNLLRLQPIYSIRVLEAVCYCLPEKRHSHHVCTKNTFDDCGSLAALLFLVTNDGTVIPEQIFQSRRFADAVHAILLSHDGEVVRSALCFVRSICHAYPLACKYFIDAKLHSFIRQQISASMIDSQCMAGDLAATLVALSGRSSIATFSTMVSEAIQIIENSTNSHKNSNQKICKTFTEMLASKSFMSINNSTDSLMKELEYILKSRFQSVQSLEFWQQMTKHIHRLFHATETVAPGEYFERCMAFIVIILIHLETIFKEKNDSFEKRKANMGAVVVMYHVDFYIFYIYYFG